MDIVIREEQCDDINAIHTLTKTAFAAVEYSSHTEHFIVDELRRAQALTLSLVALNHNDIIGHVAFSPITTSDAAQGWFALGPVSVSPQYQRLGVGSRLIKTGLEILKNRSASGCVLVGDPNYYSRFGFKTEAEFTYPDLPPEYFQVMAFNAPIPCGEVVFHEAFNVKPK